MYFYFWSLLLKALLYFDSHIALNAGISSFTFVKNKIILPLLLLELWLSFYALFFGCVVCIINNNLIIRVESVVLGT